MITCDEEKIIVCDSCKGSGKVECEIVDDPHHGTKFVWDETCSACDGLGRLVQTTRITTRKISSKELKLVPKPAGAKKQEEYAKNVRKVLTGREG